MGKTLIMHGGVLDKQELTCILRNDLKDMLVTKPFFYQITKTNNWILVKY